MARRGTRTGKRYTLIRLDGKKARFLTRDGWTASELIGFRRGAVPRW